MKSIYTRLLITLLLLSSGAYSQTTDLRGIYIDNFSQILGNTVKEDSLLHYAQDSSFNYLALYDLHNINFSNANSVNTLASFIRRARENYGIINIGAVGESYSTFRDKIAPYNNAHTNANEKFNVFNLEFEFWTTSSVNPGGYYCTQYLQPNNCGCDSSGGFKFYIAQMHNIDSLASVQGAISETYVGWFNQGQAQQIVRNTDRILLHAYRINPSSVYGYSQTRLSYLASLNQPVDVMPIFSSEPIFMGPWLASHSNVESYTKYVADYNADASSWKTYIRLKGYHWFDYGYMPHPVYNGTTTTTTPTITALGSLSFCTGGSVTLSAPANASYLWSTGATTQTISVNASGSYSCSVTQNGTAQTSNVLNVQVNGLPSSSFTVGNAQSSGVPLTSTSSAGSGSISTYRWYRDGASISGATSSTYNAIQDGSYSLVVTNSNGCSENSSAQYVTIPVTSCILSTPSGLASACISPTSQLATWSSMPQTDSVIVRYKKEGTNTYYYLRMPNTGQTSVLLTNLVSNSRYSFRIKTMCGTTASSYSAKVYFTTGRPSSTSNNTSSRVVYQEVDTQSDDDELLAYPVPANEFIQFYFFADFVQNGEISIMDISGRIVLKQNASVVEGDNSINIHTEDLLPGIYFATVRADGIAMTKRILIHH